MAVIIRIISKGDVEFILETYKTCHGIRRGTVHANLPIFVDSHKRKCGVYIFIHYLYIQSVFLGDGVPVIHACPTHGINPYLEFGRCDGLHVYNVFQILYVRLDIIVFVCGAGSQRTCKGHTLYFFHAVHQYFVGTILNNICSFSVCRPACWGVVFEASVFRRIM